MQAQGEIAVMAPNKRLLAGICLAMANFMVILDLTVANVSVPHIAGNLGVTLEQGTWTISSYAVAEAICVPLAGWLAQRFGAVRLFIASLLGFGLFSFLCGISATLGMLVACRIGQGLCGGPIMPMSQTLMLRVFPPQQRNLAMAVWAMTVMLAPAIGPIAGGYISDEISWHWIFLINVPIVLALVTGAVVLLRSAETPTRRVPIDRIGLVLLIVWVGCLQIMLDTGRDRDWFGDAWIVMLAIGAVLGFAVFVIWELTEEHPIVDLRVFRHTGFTISVLTLGIGYGAFFAGVVVVPQWLQTSLGYSATQAGTVAALHAYAAFTTAPLVARLMDRVDPRLLVSIGMGWMGVTALLRASWTSGGDFWSYGIPMMLQGVGVSLMAIPLTTMSLTSVRPEETASAAGLQSFVRTIAMAMATSLSLTVWSNAQSTAHSEIVERLQSGSAEVSLADAGLSIDQVRRVIAALVEKEAVTLAVDHVFLLAAVMLFISSALIHLAPKPRSPGSH